MTTQVNYIAPSESGDYLYSSAEACEAAGDHLTSVDQDGYCNFCGHQEDVYNDPAE